MIDFTELEIIDILTFISVTISEYGEYESHKSILTKIKDEFPNNKEIQEKTTDLLSWIGKE